MVDFYTKTKDSFKTVESQHRLVGSCFQADILLPDESCEDNLQNARNDYEPDLVFISKEKADQFTTDQALFWLGE